MLDPETGIAASNMQIKPVPVEILLDASQTALPIRTTYRARLQTFPSPVSIGTPQAQEPDLFRLLSYSLKDGILYLETETTNYTQFRRTRALPTTRERRWRELANPLGVCCVCRTVDGWLLLERRGDDVELYRGGFHVVGGYGDVQHDSQAGSQEPDFARAILREIDEELNGAAVAVDTLRLNGLAYDLRSQHPELCFSASLCATLEQVRNVAGSSPEFHEVVPVANEAAALREFLHERANQIVPTGLASLALFGKREFGPAWSGELMGLLPGLHAADCFFA